MTDFLYDSISTALLRSAPVAIAGLFLLFLMRRKSGATRHFACLVAMGVLLILPIVDLIPQRKDVSVPMVGQVMESQFVPSPLRAEPAAAPTMTETGKGTASRFSIAQVLFGLYSLVFGLLLVRQALSLALLGRTLRRAGFRSSDGPYPIRMSDSINVPIAAWWGKPTIVLPSSAVNWSDARVVASIKHETAHIVRGDLAFSWISVFTRALYWPNPLVWTLSAKLLQLAESATDDKVVREGINPTEYAEVLVQTACEVRRQNPVASLAMARTPNVAARVRAILEPGRERGSVHPVAATCSIAILMTTAFGMGRIGSGLQKLHKVAVAGTPYTDLKNGETVPAEASNDFIAETSDGAKVQLLQIQRWTPGGVEAWKPDGTLLPRTAQIPDDWHRHDPTELHIYTQIETKTSIVDDNAGIGSGPHDAGKPRMAIFMGGWPMGRVGSKPTIMSLLGIPHVGTSGLMSVTFSYSESLAKPIMTIYPNHNKAGSVSIPEGVLSELPAHFDSTVLVEYPAYGTPFRRDAHGEAIRNSSGEYLHDKVLSTKLTFTRLSYVLGNHDIDPIAYSAKTLKPIPSVWNDGHQRTDLYDFSYYYPLSPKQIDHIDIVARKTYHVAFLDFHLRPKKVSP